MGELAKMTVRIDPDTLKNLKLVAVRDGTTVQDIVSGLVVDYINGLAGADAGGNQERAASSGQPRRDNTSSSSRASAPAKPCRRQALHHTNHGGNPCPVCGYPNNTP